MEKEKKLSKEKTGAGEASFRVYYGATGAAVPFKWESQPGTPKHHLFSDYSAAPPLTPPPSYLARSYLEPDSPWTSNNNNSNNNNNYRKLKMVVLLTSLPRLVRRGSHSHVSLASYSSSMSSSMSSEASSSYYSSSSKGRKTTRGPQPLMFALMDDEFKEERRSSSMRMCFGCGGFGHSVKNALFSVVGRRRRRSSRAVDFFV